MPWGAVNVEQRRVAFSVRAAQGKETMTALCREFRICRATGYKWLRRWREGPLEAFREQSRGPNRSPRQTPAWKEELVVELRKRCPDWGAAKQAYELEQEQTHSVACAVLSQCLQTTLPVFVDHADILSAITRHVARNTG